VSYEHLRFPHRWWIADANVRALDYWDRGVLFDLAALSWDSQLRGELIMAGAPMRLSTIAAALGLPLTRAAGEADRRRSLEETIERLFSLSLLDRRGYHGALRVVKIAYEADISRRRARRPVAQLSPSEQPSAESDVDSPTTAVRRSRAHADWIRAQLADTDEQTLPELDKMVNNMAADQKRPQNHRRLPRTIIGDQLKEVDGDLLIKMEEALGEEISEERATALLTDFRKKAKDRCWMYKHWESAFINWIRAKALGNKTRDEVRARQSEEMQEVQMVDERSTEAPAL
jgi:hypothetical protein